MLVFQCPAAGVQFVTIGGDGKMLKLFVDNLVTDQTVSAFNSVHCVTMRNTCIHMFTSGAQALVGAHFGRGYSQQLISLDDVRCNGNEMTLLGCRRNPLFVHDCNHGEDAGVRCAGEFSLFSNCYGIMNVSINNITIISTHGIDLYTIFITWKRQNNSVIIQNQPNSFQIECFSDQHHLGMSVNSATYSVELVGLLPSTSYNCCVSAVYGSYTARAVCTEMVTIQPPTGQPSETPVDNSRVLSSSSVDTIGGVLGFIIAILLILLVLSGAALVYLLRLKHKE